MVEEIEGFGKQSGDLDEEESEKPFEIQVVTENEDPMEEILLHYNDIFKTRCLFSFSFLKQLSESDGDQLNSMEAGTDYVEDWMKSPKCTSTEWEYLILLKTDKQPTKFDYQIVHKCMNNDQ